MIEYFWIGIKAADRHSLARGAPINQNQRFFHAGAVPQGALHPPCAAGQADGESPLIGAGQGVRAPDVSERAEPIARGISREPAAVPDKALQQGRGAPVAPQ